MCWIVMSLSVCCVHLDVLSTPITIPDTSIALSFTLFLTCSSLTINRFTRGKIPSGDQLLLFLLGRFNSSISCKVYCPPSVPVSETPSCSLYTHDPSSFRLTEI